MAFRKKAFANISIHALREEGDQAILKKELYLTDFYPRPPRGGRPSFSNSGTNDEIFLSTPSARRATRATTRWSKSEGISIHALREEGDSIPGLVDHH